MKSQRTTNTHFFRPVYAKNGNVPNCWAGYGMDAITAFMAAASRVLRRNETLNDVRGTYIDGDSQILPVAVIEAGNASIMKNRELLEAGRSPDASCTIDVGKGVTMRYTGNDGLPKSTALFEGQLDY